MVAPSCSREQEAIPAVPHVRVVGSPLCTRDGVAMRGPWIVAPMQAPAEAEHTGVEPVQGVSVPPEDTGQVLWSSVGVVQEKTGVHAVLHVTDTESVTLPQVIV